MGPENLREYSTKEDMFPKEILPPMYISAPKRLTSAKDKLLRKLTVGPVTEPKASAL